MDHLDLAISKESKWTESVCCAISGKKAFGNQTILTASVLQKAIALSSAVSMNIDQRALQDGFSVIGNNNNSPTHGIHNRTVGSSTISKRLEVSCCEKNNPPSSIMVDDIDKGSKSSDDLENEYDGILNAKITGSNTVGDDDAVKKHNDTLTLRFIEKK